MIVVVPLESAVGVGTVDVMCVSVAQRYEHGLSESKDAKLTATVRLPAAYMSSAPPAFSRITSSKKTIATTKAAPCLPVCTSCGSWTGSNLSLSRFLTSAL
eukprot:1186889-Prymnesium_polylepis.1